MSEPFRIQRRAASAWARFRDAATTADERAVAEFCGLGANERAALTRLRAQWQAAGDPQTWFERRDTLRGYGATVRAGVLETIFRGFAWDASVELTFVRGMGARTVGEQAALSEALGKLRRKQEMHENGNGKVLVAVAEPEPEPVAEEVEAVPAGPLVARVEAHVAAAGLDLAQALTQGDRESIAAVVGGTAGSVGCAIATLRARAGVKAPGRQARPPLQSAPFPPAPPLSTRRAALVPPEALSALREVVMDHGLRHVEPAEVRDALRALLMEGVA